MFFSQLWTLKDKYTEDFLTKADCYLAGLSSGASDRISVARFAGATECSFQEAERFLKDSTDIGMMERSFVLRCPECDHLVRRTRRLNDLRDQQFICPRCDAEICDETFGRTELLKHIELQYSIRADQIPFSNGQRQAEIDALPQNDAVLSNDIRSAWKRGGLSYTDLYQLDEQRKACLLDQIEQIRKGTYQNTTQKGNSLEELVVSLFNTSMAFHGTTKARTDLNQIDGLIDVRSYLESNLFDTLGSYFFIECKNEKEKPKNDYLGKFDSILKRTGSKFGIFVSKVCAPKTFLETTREIFLDHRITIICISLDEIGDLIQNDRNLFELLKRKIIEVQSGATKTLKECGLFQA